MQEIANIYQQDKQLLLATNYKLIELNDEQSIENAINW